MVRQRPLMGCWVSSKQAAAPAWMAVNSVAEGLEPAIAAARSDRSLNSEWGPVRAQVW